MYLVKGSKEREQTVHRPERRMCLTCWASTGYHPCWNRGHSNGKLSLCNQGDEITGLVGILESQALTLREMEARRVTPSGDLVVNRC